MKTVKILMVLAVCLMFGINAYAAGRPGYNNNSRYDRYDNHKQSRYDDYHNRNVKVVKYVPVKPQPRHVTKTKTVVVHHYEQPRYSQAAETAAIVGLGIIATAAVLNAVL